MTLGAMSMMPDISEKITKNTSDMMNIKEVYYKDSFNPIMIMLIFYKILVLILREEGR